jgi:Fibronectin type III domain/Concanavalin A-like lectin/glucanases superfamily/Calcineurin-like phosphoesterase
LSLAATRPNVASSAGDPVIAAAGDIACDPANGNFNGGAGTSSSCRQRYTSDLLANAGLAAVLPLGDDQYYCGGYQAFLQSYDQSWGRVKALTRPVPGNHEYLTSGGTGCDASNAGAHGYFTYFGTAAGAPGKGYYSYDIGTWHILALNSNCGDAGGCSATSPQGQWLAADLAAHQNTCTLAYWHIPLFSSGGRASQNSLPFWKSLYAAHADVVLNGHDHIYERFFPQDPSGTPDNANGIREFIAGTGGANHTSITAVAANSELRDTTTFGVLELTLHQGSYDWKFVPAAASGTFTDSGSAKCHASGAPGDTTPPSAPTGLTAQPAQTSVGLSWSPSTDNVGVAGYNVYLGGSRIASSAGTSYTVGGLTCGTNYSLAVEAYDAAGNLSSRTPISVSTLACTSALFSDDFESGDLSHWSTVAAGLRTDTSDVHAGSWAARATSTSGTTAYATKQLSSPQTGISYKLWFKLFSQGSSVVDLLKLRSATGTALLTVFASPTGVLGYQNNVSTLSTYSHTAITTGAWHSLEVRVLVNNSNSQVQTYLDGQAVADLTKTESLGTAPVGQVQLGENIAGRTYDVAFDDVIASAWAP